jgi:hypothetical protein
MLTHAPVQGIGAESTTTAAQKGGSLQSTYRHQDILSKPAEHPELSVEIPLSMRKESVFR